MDLVLQLRSRLSTHPCSVYNRSNWQVDCSFECSTFSNLTLLRLDDALTSILCCDHVLSLYHISIQHHKSGRFIVGGTDTLAASDLSQVRSYTVELGTFWSLCLS